MFAYRFANTDERRPRHRFTLDYEADEGLQVGFEYNAAVGEWGFRATWIASRETESRPMAHFNTSSDRIGTPEGFQQYSATLAKTLPGGRFAPFVSLTYSEFERGLVFPFGLNAKLSSAWSALFLNDGRKSHVLATYATPDAYYQIGWIWFERISFTVGWGY